MISVKSVPRPQLGRVNDVFDEVSGLEAALMES